MGLLPQRQLRHLCAHRNRERNVGLGNSRGRNRLLRSVSIDCYDPQGRLWIAYEEGAEGWGKDWGAHISTGVPLYDARAIRLVGLDALGRLLDPGVDPGVALPGVAAIRSDVTTGKQANNTGSEKPDPELWKRRAPNAQPFPGANPRNSLPRLSVEIYQGMRQNYEIPDGPVPTRPRIPLVDGGRKALSVRRCSEATSLGSRPAPITSPPPELRQRAGHQQHSRSSRRFESVTSTLPPTTSLPTCAAVRTSWATSSPPIRHRISR